MTRAGCSTILACVLVAAGCGGSPPPPAATPTSATVPEVTSVKPSTDADPVAASVTVAPRRLRAGETFVVSVVLDVGPGYEIYLHDAPPPAVPTQLKLELPSGIRTTGPWSVPSSVRSESPSGHRVHVGETRFTRTIRVDDGVQPGEHLVACVITYQACNARLCLAPVTSKLAAGVWVAPR